MKFFKNILPAIVALAATICLANAADEANAGPGEMSISADRMEMHYGESIELFGNVIVADQEKMLTAEKMIVQLDADNAPKKIEAFGQVTIRRLDAEDSATGDRGIYDIESKKVILDGNCTIIHEDKNGKHILSSPQVVYDTATQNFQTAKSADGKARPTIILPAKSSDKANLNFDKSEKNSDKAGK